MRKNNKKILNLFIVLLAVILIIPVTSLASRGHHMAKREVNNERVWTLSTGEHHFDRHTKEKYDRIHIPKDQDVSLSIEEDLDLEIENQGALTLDFKKHEGGHHINKRVLNNGGELYIKGENIVYEECPLDNCQAGQCRGYIDNINYGRLAFEEERNIRDTRNHHGSDHHTYRNDKRHGETHSYRRSGHSLSQGNHPIRNHRNHNSSLSGHCRNLYR